MRIIPAIDLIDGKCVRLTQGDYAQKKIYNENPVDVARSFEDAGLKYLHLVDLDGAKAGRVMNWKAVEALTSATNLSIDFGGGVKTEQEILQLLDIGVRQINLGSIAVRNKDLVFEWLGRMGSDKIILSADVKNMLVQISGWQENASLTIHDMIRDYQAHGIRTVVCTDIATDGMLQGPNVPLYENLIKSFPAIAWVASGGVANVNDLIALRHTGVDGAIVGKAIYEGRITLEELAKF